MAEPAKERKDLERLLAEKDRCIDAMRVRIFVLERQLVKKRGRHNGR